MVAQVLQDKRVWLAIGIVAALLLFFWQAVIVQGVFFLGDTSHGYFPRLVFTANMLRQGQLPLWNPFLSLGGPHIGDPAALALYPPAWLLFLLLPAVAAYNYLILVHLALAAVFMFLYMRRIGTSAYGAIFAALIFPFSGWMLTHYEHINVFIGALYLPLLFWIIEVAFQQISWRWFVVSAFALGFYFLGAHAQMPLFASIGLLIYALGRALMAWREGWRGKKIAWTLVLLGALGILGIGLAAIQIVPTAQTVAYSNRSGGVGADVALGYSMPPEQFVTLLAPYFFGSPSGVAYWGRGTFREMTTYIGILPLLCAGIAVWQWRKNNYVRLLTIVLLVAWILAMGRYTPLYGMLAKLPLFNAVRYPPRFLFLATFALVSLAGIGFDWLLQTRLSPRARKIMLGACAVLLALLVMLNLLFLQHSFLRNTLDVFLQLYRQAQHPVEFYLERLEFALNWSTPSGAALFVFFVGLLLWLGLDSARKIPAKWLWIGGISLALLDLWIFNNSLPYNHMTDPQFYAALPENVTRIQDETYLNRVYYFDHDSAAATTLVQQPLQQGNFENYQERLREGLRGSFNMLFNISSVTGFASEEQRHYDVMRALGGLPAYDLVGDDKYSDTLNLTLLSLLNGKFVTSLEDLSDTGLTPVHRGRLINLYRNENVLPRAFVPQTYQVEQDPARVLETLRAPDFNPRQTVLLEQAPAINFSGNARGQVNITRYEPQQVLADAVMETPGIIVLSDVFYPGWRVEVDGAPGELLRADYILRGVALTAGTHRLRFYYVSDGFVVGAWITAGCLVTLAFIGAYGWWRGKKIKASPQSRAV